MKYTITINKKRIRVCGAGSNECGVWRPYNGNEFSLQYCNAPHAASAYSQPAPCTKKTLPQHTQALCLFQRFCSTVYCFTVLLFNCFL